MAIHRFRAEAHRHDALREAARFAAKRTELRENAALRPDALAIKERELQNEAEFSFRSKRNEILRSVNDAKTELLACNPARAAEIAAFNNPDRAAAVAMLAGTADTGALMRFAGFARKSGDLAAAFALRSAASSLVAKGETVDKALFRELDSIGGEKFLAAKAEYVSVANEWAHFEASGPFGDAIVTDPLKVLEAANAAAELPTDEAGGSVTLSTEVLQEILQSTKAAA